MSVIGDCIFSIHQKLENNKFLTKIWDAASFNKGLEARGLSQSEFSDNHASTATGFGMSMGIAGVVLSTLGSMGHCNPIEAAALVLATAAATSAFGYGFGFLLESTVTADRDLKKIIQHDREARSPQI